jgi:zinc finger CCHC domain-containing protein 8
VVTVAEGTPIAASCSPFRALPDRTKWAKDTTDHILFENLPDSTGKWDQMLEVLKRGRSTKRDSLQEPVL